MVRKGVGVGYFIKNVIDNQVDKEDFEVVTFKNDLPSVDVCTVYLEEFETVALKKFIEFLENN